MTIFDRPLRRLPIDLLSSMKAALADPLPRGQRWKLVPIVGGIALGGYALSFWLGDPSLLRMLVWFVGAALAHDLVLFPLYAALDRPLHLAHRRLPRTRVPLINHLRVPALGAGLTLLVFLPGIIRQGGATFTAATGLDQSPYLGRWLVFTAALFGASALVWAGRTLLIPRPVSRPERVAGATHEAKAGRGAVTGAVTGLVTGSLVGALMQFQGMFGDDGGLPSGVVFLVAATAGGAVVGVLTDYRRHQLAAATSGGALMGLLGWLGLALTLGPLLHGAAPTWTVAAVAASYRTLIGAVLYGALTGAALHGLRSVWRPQSGSVPEPAAPLTRVVIIGGGFAGISAAQRFERLIVRGAPLDVTVVSDSNFLLFTPMLAEVAGSALEPAHISAPVRSAVAHTRFRHGGVDDVDTAARVLTVDGEPVAYDHLVIAVGSVPSFPQLPGVEQHSFTLKDLTDATRLRDHVIEQLERCDQLTDPQERTRLLTVVVAGGGFAGAETVAELFDLVHGVLHLYPGITADEPRFLLVHSRDRILPELSAELGTYALARLRARGIEVRLGVRVSEAAADGVRLGDGEWIPTGTFVWAAGTRPSPFVERVAGEHAGTGALVTDATLRVTGLDGVWAVGDCARIPDVDQDGAPFPPTAQHALREGRVVADNVAAVVAGRAPVPFRFQALGVLVALGHRTAAAEIRGHRFSGFAAWLLWRGIYLAKLPGAEKRIRVLLDWLLDLVFPRDVVVTTEARAATSAAPASGVDEGRR